MSTTSRGNTFENFVTDQLKQAGWTVQFKSIRVRYGAIDFAGLWDIVLVKKIQTYNDCPPSGDKPIPLAKVQWLFVQCKSRKLYGKEKQALVDWKNNYGFAGINCLIAVKTKIKRRVGIDWTYL